MNKERLPEKGEALLARCDTATAASVNPEGYPRPVPMAKGHTAGCSEMRMATGADAWKAAEFRRNPKAGLSYSHGGAGSAMRGEVETVEDGRIRSGMRQERHINHFNEGPAETNCILLRFAGRRLRYMSTMNSPAPNCKVSVFY